MRLVGVLILCSALLIIYASNLTRAYYTPISTSDYQTSKFKIVYYRLSMWQVSQGFYLLYIIVNENCYEQDRLTDVCG